SSRRGPPRSRAEARSPRRARAAAPRTPPASSAVGEARAAPRPAAAPVRHRRKGPPRHKYAPGMAAEESSRPTLPGHAAAPVSPEEDYSQPILAGEGESDYERYLRTDALLELQKTPEEQVHRDELLFQTVHQSSELWLKLAANEVETATAHVRAKEIAPALRLLGSASLSLQ